MNYTFLAASVVAIAVTWHIAVTMMIYEALRKRGLKVSFIRDSRQRHGIMVGD